MSLLLRIIISLGLIAWTLKSIDRRQLVQSIKGMEPWLILLALGCYFLVTAVCSWRWQLLLYGRGIRIGFLRLFRYFLVGLFFGNFLPTTVGGDLMRAYLISDDCRSRAEALASVLVDRFVGLFGVIITGVAGLIMVSRTGEETLLLKYMVISVVLTLILLAIFLNKGLMKNFQSLFKLPLLNRIEEKVVEFYRSLYVYRHHVREIVLTLALSLLVQLGVVLSAFFIARAVGSEISIIPFFLYMPVIAAVSMLPVSINGWGLQEGSFTLFFGRAGMPGHQALSLGFLYHLVAVAISLLGGLLWLLRGKGRPKTTCNDMPKEAERA